MFRSLRTEPGALLVEVEVVVVPVVRLSESGVDPMALLFLLN